VRCLNIDNQTPRSEILILVGSLARVAPSAKYAAAIGGVAAVVERNPTFLWSWQLLVKGDIKMKTVRFVSVTLMSILALAVVGCAGNVTPDATEQAGETQQASTAPSAQGGSSADEKDGGRERVGNAQESLSGGECLRATAAWLACVHNNPDNEEVCAKLHAAAVFICALNP
jgi:hypothetical protein